MIDFKGYRLEKIIILFSIHGYLSYQISYRNLAEMIAERDVQADTLSIYRLGSKFTPQFEATLRKIQEASDGQQLVDGRDLDNTW